MIFKKAVQNILKKNIFVSNYPKRKCSNHDIRVRFAPSPTGLLHFGSLRTALFNYLFAKSLNGVFILRIEDTDLHRHEPQAALSIEENLNWLSLIPDESPLKGGKYGPYFQSQRLEIYKTYSQILLENGSAYKCFCSSERLQSLNKQKIFYDNFCRKLTPSDVCMKEKRGDPYCIRIKIENEVMNPFDDLIFGERKGKLINMNDTIILKSDGFPMYHFANVIDDHLMKISHVLRGNEFMNQTPLHIFIYRLFGWNPPRFGHLPLLLKSDGKKFSKRDGDVDVDFFKREGYSPISIVNCASSSGGGYASRNYDELLSIKQLYQKFDVAHIARHPAAVKLQQLKKYNQLDIEKRLMSQKDHPLLINELRCTLMKNFPDRIEVKLGDEYLHKVLVWAKDRVSTLRDFTLQPLTFLWFNLKIIPLDIISTLDIPYVEILEQAKAFLQDLSDEEFTNSKCIHECLLHLKRKFAVNEMSYMTLLRLCIYGQKNGPSIAQAMMIMGKERSLNYLSESLNYMKNHQL